ncbi:MAG TPA: sulfite exporter TauE/SafE family protein [Thermoanaerobaculia bacterium]|nr:sulfite exporter TauE/SafE family protein [Thermoanaerobaculia bacterium]
MNGFHAIVAVAAVVAGAIASVAGFGIGSILTPLLMMRVDPKVAVAAVSIPHLVATALRFWMLRTSLDRRVLLRFGLTSAAGGLLGALAHSLIGGRTLTIILGAILIFTGAVGVLGINLRFGPGAAPVAGFFSGLLGGLVGNQGGIRTGAMLGFDVPKEAFVATSTAVGLVVDGARMPVYVWQEGARLLPLRTTILIMTAGVIIGTLLGRAALGRIPETAFKRIVSALVLLLGIVLLVF